MNNTYTPDSVMKQEAETMIDAIGNCLELNNDFLDRYCSRDFSSLLRPLSEYNRAYVLDGLDPRWNFPGFIPGNDNDILLPCNEIEIQLEEGDRLSPPNDFTVDGNRAYYYTGYGLAINYNRAELLAAIQELKDLNCPHMNVIETAPNCPTCKDCNAQL